MLLRFEFRRLSPDIQRAFDDHHNFAVQVLSVSLIAFGFIYHTLIAQMEYNLPSLLEYQDFVASSHLFGLFYLTLVAIFFKKMSLSTVTVHLALALNLGYARYIYLASAILKSGNLENLTTFGIAAIYAMGIGMIAVIPFAGLVSNGFFTGFIWVQTMWLVSVSPDPMVGILITSLAFGITYLIKGLIWTLVCNYIMVGINQKEKIIQTERALILRDLELARQIQDSMSPPKELLWGDSEVSCYIHKHDAVGGDWAAIHCDASNALNLVVADAMGKGLQAALVIHAVQSLWAEAVSEEKNFNPDQWLKSLNASLYHLGKNATHFVTMGLLRIRGNECTYWSAAHVPLFLISNEHHPRIRPILSGGSPLGVTKNPTIASRSFDLSEISTLFLGTDGVFTKGSRHTERELLQLDQNISANQKHFLEDISVQDDKTLIVLRKRSDNIFRLKKAG